MKIKYRLLIITIGLILLPMAISTAVTSVVVQRQNDAEAWGRIDTALHVVLDDIDLRANELGKGMRAFAQGRVVSDALLFLDKNRRDFYMFPLLKKAANRLSAEMHKFASLADFDRIYLYYPDDRLLGFLWIVDGDSRFSFYIHDDAGRAIRLSKECQPHQDCLPVPWKEEHVKTWPVGSPGDEDGAPRMVVSGNVLGMELTTTARGRGTKDKPRETLARVTIDKHFDLSVALRLSDVTGTDVAFFTAQHARLNPMWNAQPLDAQFLERLAPGSILHQALSLETDYYAGFHPFMDGSGALNGLMSARLSKAGAIAKTHEAVTYLLVIAVFCILALIPVALFLSHRFVAPIYALMDGVHAFGSGDLDHRILEEGSAEIVELAAALNGMAGRIQHAQGELHRVLIENAVDAIFVHDENGRMVEVNQQACDSLGYTREEMLALTVGDIVPDFQWERFLEKARSLPLGEPVMFEDTQVRRDGSVFPVEIRRTALLTGERKIIVALARDISERKEAAERLAQESEKLRAVVENMAQGVIMYDADWNLVLCNERYKGYFDLPPSLFEGNPTFDDIEGWTLRNDYPAEEFEQRLKAGKEPERLHQPWGTELVRGDGRALALLSSPVPAGGFLITCTDVTAQKQAAREIEESTALLKATFDYMSDGITIVDKDCRHVMFNRKFQEFLEIPAGPFDEKPKLEDMVRYLFERGEYGEEYTEADIRELINLYRRDERSSLERQRPGGRYLAVRGTPLPGGGRVTLYTDITERKRAEKELEEKTAMLQATLDHMGEGITMVDAELRVVEVNSKFLEMVELERAFFDTYQTMESVYRYFNDHGEYGERLSEKQLQRLVTKARALEPYRYEHRRPDGTVIEVRGNPMPDGGTVTTYSDITDRKQIEEELRQSEGRLRSFIDVSPTVVAYLDRDSRYRLVNARYLELLGAAADKVLGKTITEVLGKEVAEMYRPHIEQVLLGKELNIEVSREVRDIGMRHLEVSYIPDQDERGTVVGFYAGVRDITDGKKAEEALQASEERFRGLAEGSIQGIMVHKDLKPLFVNRAFAEMFGYSSVEEALALNASAVSFFAPEERERIAGYAEARARGESPPARYEAQGLRKDGSTQWVEMVATRVTWDGEPALQVTYADISERKHAEQVLAEKERQLRYTLDSMGGGIFMVDRNLELQVFNEQFRELYNLPEEVVQRGVSIAGALRCRAERGEYGAGDVNTQVEERLSNYREGKAQRFEDVIAGGRVLDAVWTPTEEGGVVVVAQDITDRKHAEEALALSESRFRAFLDNATDMAAFRDLEGRYLFVNKRFAEMRGMASEELIGKTVHALYPPKRARIIEETDRRVLAAGVASEEEFSVIETDGQRHSFLAGLFPVFGPGGEVAGVGTLTKDITDRKQAERELEEAKRAADEANRAKSVFVANIGHEIRTPLNAIVGLTHLTMQTDLSGQQQDYLRKIRGAGSSLLGIINDILDFSKIEAQKLELEQVDFSLDVVLEMIASVIAVGAREKGLTFSHNRTPGTPEFLVGDPLRLGQVLTNLTSNAIKFTERGEVMLGVEQTAESAQEVTLRFTLKDTGIGMTEEQMEGVFQAFTQADVSTTRQYGGTGLGLTISQQLAHLMGGQINVESELGTGSTFTLELPFARGSKERAVTQREYQNWTVFSDEGVTGGDGVPPGSARLEAMEGLAGASVLVAEDIPVNQQIVRELLEAAGLAVTIVENGREALAALQQQPFDVVLMDIQMPAMDGYQATIEIRGQERFADLPIIAMSAHAMMDDRQKCLAVGMNDHISKPVDPDLLLRTLRKWVRGPVQGESTPRPTIPESADGAQLPAALPGIDLEAGLARVAHNAELYRKLLAEFHSDHRDTAATIRKLLKAGEREPAERLAHALKGVAGNLGAAALHEAAGSLETALREGKKGEAARRRLAGALKTVMDGLAALPADGPADAASPGSLQADAPPLEEIIEDLFIRLKSRSFQAAASLPALRAALAGRLGDLLSTLQEQIDAFAFDEASATLASISSQVGAITAEGSDG